MTDKNTRFALNLFALVAGMLMLAYASVPLYRLFCQMTGYGGTTQVGTHAPGAVEGHDITVTFNADTDPSLNWQFKPGQKSMKVKVGEQSLAYYTSKNLDSVPVKGHAVYNVLPFTAGSYFVKIECFCFTEQTLPPGKEVHMPISFYIDPAILKDPDLKNVSTITLSYTFFPVKK